MSKEQGLGCYVEGLNMTKINKAAQSLGKLGGLATRKKLGVEHYKRISVLGVEARKSKRQAMNS